MEQWEKNLRDGMSANGFHDIQKKNDRLLEWCKDWKSVVEERDGFSVSIGIKYQNGSRYLQAEATYIYPWKPFIAQLGYFSDEAGQLLLYTRVTKGYDMEVMIKNALSGEEQDIYLYTEDSITGLEMLEKGYVLETLNQAFLNYFTKRG